MPVEKVKFRFQVKEISEQIRRGFNKISVMRISDIIFTWFQLLTDLQLRYLFEEK